MLTASGQPGFEERRSSVQCPRDMMPRQLSSASLERDLVSAQCQTLTVCV